MVKLQLKLIPKCPKCRKQLCVAKAQVQESTIYFIYCPDSQCRYARVDKIEHT